MIARINAFELNRKTVALSIDKKAKNQSDVSED
jgi:hypothetical protein